MISTLNKPQTTTTTTTNRTSKLLTSLNKSLRYERNYSYIEAMKDDVDTIGNYSRFFISTKKLRNFKL
jgi:hypothetical protein